MILAPIHLAMERSRSGLSEWSSGDLNRFGHYTPSESWRKWRVRERRVLVEPVPQTPPWRYQIVTPADLRRDRWHDRHTEPTSGVFGGVSAVAPFQ
jgi:hypothetical protein